jgi:chemotaxis protein CheC
MLAERHLPDIDLLRELASIGCGRGVTALGRLASRTAEMAVPDARVTRSAADLAEHLDPLGDDVVGVGTGIEGFLGGDLALLLSDAAARQLASLLGQPVPRSGWTEFCESALLEAGNIVGSAFVSALGRLTGRTLLLSVPVLARGAGRRCLDALAPPSGEAVTVATRFSLRAGPGERHAVSGVVVARPNPAHLPALIAALPGH